jgi:hypothetical protein
MTSVHLVAAVMGVGHQVAYMPCNILSVIEDASASDSNNMVSRRIKPQPCPLVAPLEEAAPLRVPHLYWHCAMVDGVSDFPTIIHTLLDHGSHLVLIRENFAASLGLCRRRLHMPEKIELAMSPNSKKEIMELHEWVPLRLEDPSGLWKAWTVKAIVTLSLCAPVILGLPFLAHNHIVIDHADRTAVQKDTGFDLLGKNVPEKPAAKRPRV